MKADSRFERLLTGSILGVVDSYGAVHSEYITSETKCHEDLWPGVTHCCWRWNHNNSVFCIFGKPSEEDFDKIQRHLSRKYGLKWWDNGHHDIDHLLLKAGRKKTA